jgi:hypothetical protein
MIKKPIKKPIIKIDSEEKASADKTPAGGEINK